LDGDGFKIEADPRLDGMRVAHFADPADLGLGDTSTEEVRYHLTLLMEAGFIDGKPAAEMPMIRSLTMAGHDFLDKVRDPEIWAKTKAGAKLAGSFSLKLLGDLATGFVKTKIEHHTGVKL
jgi:hypothetical protein